MLRHNLKLNFITFLMICFSINSNLFSQEDDRGFLVKIGQKAPDFSAKMIDGTTFKLSDNLGKIVVLQFTASWCSVCIKEMPLLEKEIWQIHKDKNFILIGVDRDEPLETVRKFAKATKITYPLVLDPGADIFGLYANKNSGVTRNIVINSTGEIVFMTRLFDQKEFDKMKEIIFKLVEESHQKLIEK